MNISSFLSIIFYQFFQLAPDRNFDSVEMKTCRLLGPVKITTKFVDGQYRLDTFKMAAF